MVRTVEAAHRWRLEAARRACACAGEQAVDELVRASQAELIELLQMAFVRSCDLEWFRRAEEILGPD